MASKREVRRPFKRQAISDQQRRRELSLLRQAQNRQDAHSQARRLATTILSLQHFEQTEPQEFLQSEESETEHQPLETDPGYQLTITRKSYDIRQASKLRGAEGRRWFAKQLMLPEWMIDIPDHLATDWYVFARPAGKRCFVVSSDGMTISRLRNGSLLHRFPSALPSGARSNSVSRLAQSYCILDCIFHESDQTYYVIDMVCWAGVSFYECTAEFRFFWLSNKLVETGACDAPSLHHRFRFSAVSLYNCDQEGLRAAYAGTVPYVKDGLLFYNKHAHYQTGNTPLVLVWKDEKCSQYVIDTDSKGQIPNEQQVVLELLEDGRLATSDDPPVSLGSLCGDFIQKTGLQSGNLLRFSVREGGLGLVEGKLEKADLQYFGKVHHARAFADSYSKVVFQYMVRHSPLNIDLLFESISCRMDEDAGKPHDVEMVG